MTTRSLSERERAFCGHYVANSGNAADAARKAGYSDKSAAAKIAGGRLLKRPGVQAELRRIEAVNKNVVDLLTKSTTEGRELTTAERKQMATVDPGVSIGLTVAYAQHVLLMAAAMASGEAPRRMGVVLKDPKGVAPPKVHHVDFVQADPREAAICGKLLLDEALRVETPANGPPTIEGEVMDAGEIDAARAARGLPPVPDDFDPEKEP